MSERNFMELHGERQDKKKFVCVGLDSDLSKIPQVVLNDKKEVVPRGDTEEVMYWFNRAIIDATCDLVGSFKANWAFYLAEGLAGMSALKRTVEYIKMRAPGVPMIGDMKSGDIGNSNTGYVKAAFEFFSFDAVTLPPYMGGESLRPFLDKKDKGFFVLCRTSNPGAGEFQDLTSRKGSCIGGHEEPLFMKVARAVVKWNVNGNCGLVVGATYPEELGQVRGEIGDMPILIPAIGAQGGGVEGAVRNGISARKKDALFHSAREVIFASSGDDHPEAARGATEKLDKGIGSVLASMSG